MMPTLSQNIDRSRTLAVAEDAERITGLAQELQRNAAELEGQSHRLRGTIRALESANTELHHKASELASAHSTADSATARLERLQRITAALSDTVTQDAVADSVLTEACVALECDAGAVVVTTEDGAGALVLLREAGELDPLMRSFGSAAAPGFGPYAEAIGGSGPIYLESSDRMAARYPAFRDAPVSGGRGAWIFLPLEIERQTVGALAFGFTGPRAFSHAERQFADTVARYCAQALDRVRLRVAAARALAEARDARLLAEQATNAQTQFMRGMSHELRTPLNAISGYAALLADGIRGEVNEEQLLDLGRIRRASSYLLGLINDVLTVARLEGVRPLELAAIVVNPVLAEVEGLCAVQAKASGLTLSVCQPERTLVVEADGERLQQILLNLITNAIKFTTPGGSIAVTCDGDAHVVRLTVQDTGVGVPPIDIDRVFEPFVQIDRHLTNASLQGIGLGLSISRDLARAMRGDLTLKSTVGVGSTFTVTLPTGLSPAPVS
jgi:signal transduction histidine kinase